MMSTFKVIDTFYITGRGTALAGFATGLIKLGDTMVCGELRTQIRGIERWAVAGAEDRTDLRKEAILVEGELTQYKRGMEFVIEGDRMQPVGRSAIGYDEVLTAIEEAFKEPCLMHDLFIACTMRSEKAAVAVLNVLRNMDEPTRMEAMGMYPLGGQDPLGRKHYVGER